jgi:hypothetical protein
MKYVARRFREAREAKGLSIDKLATLIASAHRQHPAVSADGSRPLRVPLPLGRLADVAGEEQPRVPELAAVIAHFEEGGGMTETLQAALADALNVRWEYDCGCTVPWSRHIDEPNDDCICGRCEEHCECVFDECERCGLPTSTGDGYSDDLCSCWYCDDCGELHDEDFYCDTCEVCAAQCEYDHCGHADLCEISGLPTDECKCMACSASRDSDDED